MSGQLRKEDIIQQQQIQDALAAIAKSVEPVMQGFKKIADEGERLNKSLGGADGLKNLMTLSQKAAKNTKDLTAAEKERIRVEKELQKTIAKTNALKTEEGKKLVEERVKLQEATKAARENAKAKLGLTKNTNGLTGAFRNMIRSIGLYAAAIFGLSKLIQFFTRDLLNQVKTWSALHFSMQTVIKDQDELAATQAFLSKTAINYGQDILALSERYVKFRAAAMQSNLTAKDTMGIFNSMAKAAGVLGLKTDEVSGVFLALEQMISKGKVTTEELRRQLGERLPGAFGIMAESLGVSLTELDKMLKAGEVLSAEVLPGFAKAVEEAYGIENVRKIDNLVAAHGRLKTSWKQFVEEISADKAYMRAIQNWTNIFTRMRIIGDDFFSDGAGLLDKYMLMSTTAGKAVRKFSDELDELSFEQLQASETGEKYINFLKDSGLTAEHATMVWNDYFNAREAAFNIDKQKADFTLPFNVEEYRKTLQEAETEFTQLEATQSGAIKDRMKENAAFWKKDSDTYKKYLKGQLDYLAEYVTYSESSYKSLEEILDLKRRNDIEITKQERQELDNRLMNYQNYLDAYGIVSEELYGSKGKSKTAKDDRLNILKEQQAAALEETKKHQQELILQHKYTEDELLRVKYDNNKELLKQELSGLEKQKELAGDNALELAKIDYNVAKIKAEIAKDLTEWLLDEEKRRQEKIKEEREKAAEDELSDIYFAADTARVERAKQSAEEIQRAGANQKKKREILINAAIDKLKIEHDAQQKIIESDLQSEEEKKKAAARQLKIQEQLQEEILEITFNSQQQQIEQYQKTLNAVATIGGQFFDITSNLYEGQLQRIENFYAAEIAAAGNSVEKRILAERKYEREKAKILQKQAVAQKADAAFGIIINTAQAIMATLGQTGFFGTPLAAIIGAMGAAQLATVLAQPIPQYATGTKSAEQTFIAGEEGQEAIITKKGDVVLTPDKPTLFSDKAFVGSTILPHDETQRMLANYAATQSHDVIDMSKSNRYLKDIANNTKRTEVFNSNGKKVIKRGYITSTVI